MKVEKRYLSLPLTAQLEITDFCNHRCIHCYNLDSTIENRPARKVSDETVLACTQKSFPKINLFAHLSWTIMGKPLLNHTKGYTIS